MLDIMDKGRRPSVEELTAYCDFPLFQQLLERMEREHRPLPSVDYSGDQNLPGWNLRLRKGGRTLLRLYPRPGRLTALVVVGRREKERAEALLPSLSEPTRALYARTKEGMGQRWLLLELTGAEAMEDALALARLRR